MQRYNPSEIEPRWQKVWEDNQSFVVDDNDPRPKYYHLVEFPYPSGSGLHVGHARSYVAFDVMSRWRRMTGQNVLYPIGWDSFGLPAEQYAIKTGIHPSKTVVDNIATFRRQAKRLGLGFDWSREFSTADPKIYKWTQWIFLNLFKHGLAYQAESLVWWCEDLKSVLADEEVINGRSERGDYPCERRPLRQWMLAITKYADRLYDDLDDVDYIEPIKVQQRNWIGRSKGAEVTFSVDGANDKITVFTTRPDTLFGATYMVLAPEHPLVVKLTGDEQKKSVEDYVKLTAAKSDLTRQEDAKEKSGVFIGAYAINPVNNEKMPIWISDYVLMGYGTGAIMAVPAHDKRDWEFAKKFSLPIVRVVKNSDPDDACTSAEGTMINSAKYDDIPSDKAREQIVKDLELQKVAKEMTNYKLRDWVFSRQRYWGEPFPIVWVSKNDYDKAKGLVSDWLPKLPVTKEIDGKIEYALPIPPDQLPVVLPEVDNFHPQGLGKGPLALAKDWNAVWFNTDNGEALSQTKPKPPGDNWVSAMRETDTMPNWAGSSWYFLRYLDPTNDNALAGEAKIKQWMPVNWYNGGMEHTTLHLLYSRFWHKFLFDIGIVNSSEPYKKRTSHGIVIAQDNRKMSKSLGNVVDPLEVISDYGADTLRLYICFLGPFDQMVSWSVSGVAGCRRFIDRLWVLVNEYLKDNPTPGSKDNAIKNKELNRVINEAARRITLDIPRLGFNTAVAALMEAVNSLYKHKNQLSFKDAPNDWLAAFNRLVLLSTPFMPHVSEELWAMLGNKAPALEQLWPDWDDKALTGDTVVIVIQINGKLRSQINVPTGMDKDEAVKLAKADSKVTQYLKGNEIKKTIYVDDKLVNFVVS